MNPATPTGPWHPIEPVASPTLPTRIRLGMEHDHFMPTTKRQLLQYFTKKYPNEKAKFEAMPFNQLMAIWHRLWADAGHACCKRNEA